VKSLCRFLPLLFIALALTGCGRGKPHVPVTGTVKYADGSVPKGVIASITFQPASAGPESKGASSTINPEDGSFELSTVQPGDGALPGDYVVTLNILDAYPRGKSVVPEKYRKVAETPLKATVDVDGDNVFPFVVEKQ
jgi:hypothetical protein